MEIAIDEMASENINRVVNQLAENGNENTDWKRRTVELEEQLLLLRERVNSQTGKIRDAVSKRVQDSEERAKNAESREEITLKKMAECEERTLAAEKKVTRCYRRNQHLEDIIEQKESIIRQLRFTVAEEQRKHDADVSSFEKKVAQVREWVAQIVGELQNEIEALKAELVEKDKIIQDLRSDSNHVYSPVTISNDSDEEHPEAYRERSKSAANVISRDNGPAVPPRRASLGVMSRTNTNIKVGSKPMLRTLDESENFDSRIYAVLENNNSIEENDNVEADRREPVEDASSSPDDGVMNNNEKNNIEIAKESKDAPYSININKPDVDKNGEMNEHGEQLLTDNKGNVDGTIHDPDVVQPVDSPPNSRFYISHKDEEKGKAAVRITMRERLKQLTESNEDMGHSSEHQDEQTSGGSGVKSSPRLERKTNNHVTELMNSLEIYAEDEAPELGMEHKVILKLSTGNKQQQNVASKPGETDELGYTKLFYGNENKVKATDKNDQSTFTSYLPPGYVLAASKVESDSSGCSSLEHTPPMRGSWSNEPKTLNPVINGVISSEEWKRSGDLETIHGTQDGFACNLIQAQKCPVYAQLEGRASKIQSNPCTGDSTDSSDNDDSASGSDGEPLQVGRAKSISVGDRLLRRGSTKRKVLKTCAQYTTHNLKSEALQKTGYLSKLGGRIKNWKRRWFVLSEDKLSYYKTENDVNKKALGQIPLDGFCGIRRTEGSLSFQVDTAKRRYYLTGETVEDIDDWLKVLQNVLRKFMASPLLAQVNEKALMKGWMTKVKLGKSKRCYCILRGKYLCYYKSESDQAPFAILNMKEVQIERICSVDSEDDLDCDDCDTKSNRFTLRLYNEKQSVYFLVDNKHDHNAWLYHLTMASGHIEQNGTEFERTIAKLKDDDNPESVLWNCELITHSKEPLVNPLTTLPSEELENKALQLFKSIQLFSNTECVPGPAIDYHVVYAQNALQMCIAHVELREEIYCQLMKQTAKRVHVLSDSADALERFLAPHSEWFISASRSYSVASDATIDLRPTREYVYEQCWQLLVLCCTLFVPRGQVLWFLKAHLQRYSSKETVMGKYAKYCRHCLDRTIQNGEREAGPSRMEVIAVLLDEPFEHKYPLKIPVHFVNRTSEEFGFDGATTVQELVDSINSEIGLRSTDQSGYALYTDNPVGPIQHCLQTSVKLCDVIAKWEKAMQSCQQGRFEPNRMIKLSYKNRLYFKSLAKTATPRERYFLVYQTFQDILHGRFPISKDRCIQMAALMAQMECGDRVASDNQCDERISMILDRFYPVKLKEPMSSEQRRQLKNKFLDAWQSLMGKSKQEAITLYLCMAKSWTTFGAKLFKAKQRRVITRKRDSATETMEDIWLAVEEDCISILDVHKMNPVFKYKYRSVVTFGGWKEDFMLVVNKTTQKGPGQSELGTERLLFVMPRGKILEITLLIASYINAIVRQQGITFDVTYTTKETTAASEKNIKVWDMESAEWPMVPGAGLI